MNLEDVVEGYNLAIRRWHDRMTDNSLIIGQLDFMLKTNPTNPDRLKVQSTCLMKENEALANLIHESERDLAQVIAS